jgi:hypothetical protein
MRNGLTGEGQSLDSHSEAPPSALIKLTRNNMSAWWFDADGGTLTLTLPRTRLPTGRPRHLGALAHVGKFKSSTHIHPHPTPPYLVYYSKASVPYDPVDGDLLPTQLLLQYRGTTAVCKHNITPRSLPVCKGYKACRCTALCDNCAQFNRQSHQCKLRGGHLPAESQPSL